MNYEVLGRGLKNFKLPSLAFLLHQFAPQTLDGRGSVSMVCIAKYTYTYTYIYRCIYSNRLSLDLCSCVDVYISIYMCVCVSGSCLESMFPPY